MSDILIFNRRHLQQQRERAAENFSKHSFLFDWAADQIIDRLRDIKKDFSTVYSIGNRVPEAFWHELTNLKKIDKLTICDLTNAPVIADSEFLPFAENSADLVLSILDFHSVNDLPGTLSQIKKILKPDGLFIGCILGGETLFELRESLMNAEINLSGGASPRVAPFADKLQAGALMQRAGFALPVIDSEILRVSYQNLFNLMGDLRGMGESNTLAARQKNFTSSRLFFTANQYYETNFPDKEDTARITASFEIIFMLGWSPHESQQKPLRRGSAEHSLAEFLH